MTLGEKLRAARLEAGLSQRTLCGDRITRNMLSQIENGSARPSMATLEFLAGGLGKPVSYFLEEDAVSTPNLTVIRQARERYAAGAPEEALQTLKSYRQGDEIFDPEYYLLLSLVCLRAAEQAAAGGKIPYAEALLTRCLLAGEKTLYPGPKKQALALEAWLKREDREQFQKRMEALGESFTEKDGGQLALLFARSAVNRGKTQAARLYLENAPADSPESALLLGESYLAERAYAPAAEAYLRAEGLLEAQGADMRPVYERLETCFREMEDYKMAYYYAAKQK